MEKLSYALGMVIAHNLKGMGVSALDNAAFTQAVSDVMGGATTTMSDAEAQRTVSEFMQKQQAEADEAVREAGEKFLAENAEKPGVVVLPSGLQYTVITEGTGAKPKATDRVKCHYEGTLTNGQVFDSSVNRGEPATFPLNRVIPGWTEGVQLMKEGAKYTFFIPSDLAYGPQGVPGAIPPHSTLIFDVELIKVMKK